MTWNYRIVHYRAVGTGYGLHEVYYNDKGEPVTMGTDGARFHADADEGPSAIVEMLSKALKDAQQRGVLEEPEHWPGASKG